MIGIAPGDLAQKRLAGCADHERLADFDELAEALEQLEVVLDRLAEADARIEHHTLARDPA
jgi:hypothetical protein